MREPLKVSGVEPVMRAMGMRGLWCTWALAVALAGMPLAVHQGKIAVCLAGASWSYCRVFNGFEGWSITDVVLATLIALGILLPRRAHARAIASLQSRIRVHPTGAAEQHYRSRVPATWHLPGWGDLNLVAMRAFAPRLAAGMAWTLSLGFIAADVARIHQPFGDPPSASPPWATLPWVLAAFAIACAHAPTESRVFGWVRALTNR